MRPGQWGWALWVTLMLGQWGWVHGIAIRPGAESRHSVIRPGSVGVGIRGNGKVEVSGGGTRGNDKAGDSGWARIGYYKAEVSGWALWVIRPGRCG